MRCFIVLLFCVMDCFMVSSSYDMSGIFSGDTLGGIPLGHTAGDGVLDLEGVCSSPGPTCYNCTHLVNCIPLPTGWLRMPLAECQGCETCNAKMKSCSKNHVPECSIEAVEYEHICEQVGIFPDAIDCRKFHLCSPASDDPEGAPAEHREALCPRHYAYNPHTAQCSIFLQFGQCGMWPVPKCHSIGQSDVLERSPNYYYICLSKHGILHPQIFICPHGWTFWGGFCRPENQPTEMKPSSATPQINQEITPNSIITTEAARGLDSTIDKAKTTDEKSYKINENKNRIDHTEKVNKKWDEAYYDKKDDDSKSDETATEQLIRVDERTSTVKVDDDIKEKVYNIFNDFGYPPEKTSTYPPDTFLADKYDFSGLDTAGLETNQENFDNYDVGNSYELVIS